MEEEIHGQPVHSEDHADSHTTTANETRRRKKKMNHQKVKQIIRFAYCLFA